jgi:hypothetical protein
MKKHCLLGALHKNPQSQKMQPNLASCFHPFGTTCSDLITLGQTSNMEEVGITFANVNDYGKQFVD